jgi:hypothetical protein
LVGYATDRHPQSARILLMILSGAVLYGWARTAWRARARRGPRGFIATRALDRLITALGTFFAFMLWARFVPQAPVAFARTMVVVLCALGLAGGLIATVRILRP